jgi:hypothetical protein
VIRRTLQNYSRQALVFSKRPTPVSSATLSLRARTATTGKVRFARHPVAFIHQLVKLIVRHSLSVTTRSRRDGLRADHHNYSTVGDVIPISIMFRVIADVLAVRYRDTFVENGFTKLPAVSQVFQK